MSCPGGGKRGASLRAFSDRGTLNVARSTDARNVCCLQIVTGICIVPGPIVAARPRTSVRGRELTRPNQADEARNCRSLG
jgi:hypothetical protein